MEDSWEALVRYWRTSIADSTLGQGSFRQRDIEKLTILSEDEWKSGRLTEGKVERLFKGRPPSLQVIAVRLWPVVAALRTVHGVEGQGLPEFVAPVVTEALLGRDGQLKPGRTVVARDVLDPLPDGMFSIGTVKALDDFLTKTPFYREVSQGSSWTAYLQHHEEILKEVAGGWPAGDANYELTEYGLIEGGEEGGYAGRKILKLYDHILKEKPHAPLLKNYASAQVRETVPCLPHETDLAQRLGHSNDRFPLAEHQRSVLAHLAVVEEGEILAVNGLPGTGKTTMLLSAIAGEWIKAALDGGAPPVIVAASSNNQAVTNIIDAFGKDFATGEGAFAGRWLPDIGSFGLFLPAQSREAKAARDYQTESFFREIETPDYVLPAERDYLAAAGRALPHLQDPDVEQVVAALQGLMREEAGKLTTADAARGRLAAVAAEMTAELGPDPETAHAARQAQHGHAAADHAARKALVERWEDHLASESIFLALFKFLPPVAARRTLRARIFLRDQGDEAASAMDQPRLGDMDAHLRAQLSESGQALVRAEDALARATELIARHRQSREDWAEATHQLGGSTEGADDVVAVDRRADCTVRFRLFLLATHYWEGRWLLEMRKLLPDVEKERKRRGQKAVEPRWRRRMMLTPCAVATFSTLPEKLIVSRYDDDNDDYFDDYLYGFIDLLIVDEAGQVLPEAAGASFALAKKALVIGDTKQIAPISSIPAPVDIGNLQENGLLRQEHHAADHSHLLALGLTSSNGSAMRVAQNACRYHPYPDLDRGLYLFEHRRCYDDIIAVSNALCYGGRLQPRRGPAGADAILRPLSYLHVDGLCATTGGSRYNLLEARTIAAWLADHRARLEKYYERPLEEIVGIVTPFGGQVRAIRHACGTKEIKTGGEGAMTIGTVHALQGAERPLVIFSAVYSKHADGRFIDGSPGMLNVAASRARDGFLVFGDMDVFSSAPPDTPRARLASYLFSDRANALAFGIQPRKDLSSHTGIETLQHAAQHDSFLLQLLEGGARQIQIVSPWITVSTMKSAGILDGLRRAVRHGAKVHIYVDPDLNMPHNSENGPTPLEKAVSTLEAIGVQVIPVRQLHSKIVMADDDLLCVGSFNWLSAHRSGQYARHETSVVYRGAHLEKEISVIRHSLKKRSAGGDSATFRAGRLSADQNARRMPSSTRLLAKS